ncbi:MAG: ABC transporter permease [Chitinophagaceae bacterium]|nr:ABC transporter permease [Chitinophagaceae bacterium]
MFKNYFKIAWRNLQKNKLYTFVNITGLTVGIVSCILIGLYVSEELSYDKFHDKADRIARVTMQYTDGTTINRAALTGTKVGPQFRRTFPAITAFARTVQYSPVVSVGDKTFNETHFLYADSAFFSIFTFPLLKGNPATVLAAPNQVVLTETMAKKYFGESDPIGKTLKVNNGKDYTITGIARDAPENSQIRFNFVASFSSMRVSREEIWWTANYVTYLLLPHPQDLTPLQRQITAYMQTDPVRYETGAGAKLTYFLEPLTWVHLHSTLDGLEPNGNITYIYILSAVAVLILLIACVNYTNLATAQAQGRTGEISIRKVLGAGKGQLFRQYLGESLMLTVIALLLAVFISIQLLPLFNQIANKSLSSASLLQPLPILSLLLLGLLVSLLAGAYPALVLSNIRLMSILRSGFRLSSSGGNLRKSLIVLQFVISVFLMISTMVILQQLSFIQNKKLGYDKDHVLVLPASEEIHEKYDAVKAAIRQVPQVINTGGASGTPTYVEWTDGLSATTETGQKNFTVKAIPCDADFVKTLGMQIIAGSNFNAADMHMLDTTDNNKNFRYTFILNESAVKALGWTPQQAIGKTVEKYYPGIVRAVVKDFHFSSMHEAIGPLILFQDTQWVSRMYIKVSGKDLPGTIARLQSIWKEYAPHYPFEYHFLDEDYNTLYKTETRTGELFGVFSLTAILLACLGLFALAAYTTAQRTKEIGIRKVLGASLASLVGMLSKDFLRLVAIASLIALPMSWWAMNRWLQGFVYHITLSWWMFATVILLALFIALATVSFQAIRAGLANPVKSLRSE